ncbi:MAG: hypothetical protein KDE08_02500 [Rhodobacteraceae bacterium]|nr:hypothetical protein [Paracoccaceae bacterium]
MQLRRRALAVGTTFFLAAATGHVMQKGETTTARMRTASLPPSNVLTAVVKTSGTIAAPKTAAPVQPVFIQVIKPNLPELPEIHPVGLGKNIVIAAVSDTGDIAGPSTLHKIETDPPVVLQTADYQDVDVDPIASLCADTLLTLGEVEPAMLQVTVSAPCHPDAVLTLRHAGLVFSAKTDRVGNYSVLVPALSAEGSVSVEFGGHETLFAAHPVAGLDNVARTGLQWLGASGFHLNAFEGGADIGSSGHISYRSPGSLAEGSFLTVLGDPSSEEPRLAEVYTASKSTQVQIIQVEAEVTENLCGRSMIGQKLNLDLGGALSIQPVAISMPPCDAVGDYVVLSFAHSQD